MSAEEWFPPPLRPDAPAAIASYISAPPRGMTNAPRNPKVREALLKDLQEYAIGVAPPVWPPQRAGAGPPGGGSLEMRWRLKSSGSRSSPAVLNGVTCPYQPPAKKGVSPQRPAQRPKVPRPEAAEAPPAATEKKPSKWFYSRGLDAQQEMDITLERSGTMRLGISDQGGLLLASPEPGTLVQQWNSENPNALIRAGDRIVEVNEVRDDIQKMIEELRTNEVLDLKVRKAWDLGIDSLQLSRGSPTARWRPQRSSLDEVVNPPVIFSREREKDATGRLPSRGSVRQEAAWQRPGSEKPNRAMSDSELRNARDALKGQSGLHVAAAADRFRFAWDASKGAPLCIKGGGVPTGMPADVWASDGAFLNNYHNGAVRSAYPSALQPLKEEDQQVRKKKKGKGEDDDDELTLSASGMFQPIYPIDDSLKSLRRLKKTMFPDVVRHEEEEERRRRHILSLEEEAAKRASLGREVMTALNPLLVTPEAWRAELIASGADLTGTGVSLR